MVGDRMIDMPDLKLSDFTEVYDLRELWEEDLVRKALQEGVDEKSYDKIYIVIMGCFPNHALSAADESVVFKIAEMLLELYDCEDEESLKEFLADIIDYVNGQKQLYNNQLNTLSDKINMDTYYTKIGRKKSYPTKQSRINAEYCPECINQVLIDLDLSSEYYNYKYGWRYERQKALEWVSALAHKTLLMWAD